MKTALPFPPLNAKRTHARIARRMAVADRAAQAGDQLAYSRPDPLLEAYWAHIDHLSGEA